MIASPLRQNTTILSALPVTPDIEREIAMKIGLGR